jgi:hypothetical protein
MKEDTKNGKPKKIGEIGFFFLINFLYITSNIFIIKAVINKNITWHVYVNLILFYFFGFFLLHDMYRRFFLQVKFPNRLKSFILIPEVICLIQNHIFYMEYHPFLLSHFIKTVFFDILIVLFTWGILVWFEKRRNKKSIIDYTS